MFIWQEGMVISFSLLSPLFVIALNPTKSFALIVSPKSKNNSITMNLSYQQCKIEVVECGK